MEYYRHPDLGVLHVTATASLAPPNLSETAWDILLALHSDRRRKLSLGKLGALISTPQMKLGRWLSSLEDQRLVTGEKDDLTGQLRAVLTSRGRDLLNRYLSAVGDLEAGSRH